MFFLLSIMFTALYYYLRTITIHVNIASNYTIDVSFLNYVFPSLCMPKNTNR